MNNQFQYQPPLTLAAGVLRRVGEIQQALGLKDRKSFRDRYLRPPLALVAMPFPEKPNRRLQRYRLTGPGRRRLAGKERP
jgi:hypothetical protein